MNPLAGVIARVYFMRPAGSDGPVKIGYSCDPVDRLKVYAKWSPWPLEIAATIEITGSRCSVKALRLEQRFHQRHLQHHMHHEWFEASPLLLEDIRRINSGEFKLSELPESSGRVLA